MFFREKKIRRPKHGEERVTRKFAWKPTKIIGGTVWLETYFIIERFYEPISGNAGWWSVLSIDRGELRP